MPYGGGPALQVPDAQCTKFAGYGTGDFANEPENQRFRDFNNLGYKLHVVSNGTIKLRATNTSSRTYQPFEAAALRSKFVFKPGATTSYFITSRVVLPDVLGIWPAFFLYPSTEPNGQAQWPPEVDIFEAPINGSGGENPYTLVQHAQVQAVQTVSGTSEWTFGAPGFNTDWGFWTSDQYLRHRWIEIGAEWTADQVCYFVDGLKTGCENYRWVTNDGTPANPATIVMFLAVGGPWAGANGIDKAAFPTALEVDYIRIYQKAGQG
jgi:beta-glucanase (GH16 family)